MTNYIPSNGSRLSSAGQSCHDSPAKRFDLIITPDLPGFMRRQETPQAKGRRRTCSLDLTAAHDSRVTSPEEKEYDLTHAPFFIPGITGAARCLEGKSQFVQREQRLKLRSRLTSSPRSINFPEDEEFIKYNGSSLDSIHYEHLSQSLDTVRSLLTKSKSKIDQCDSSRGSSQTI